MQSLEISVKATGADHQQLAVLGSAVGEALRQAFAAAGKSEPVPARRRVVEG